MKSNNAIVTGMMWSFKTIQRWGEAYDYVWSLFPLKTELAHSKIILTIYVGKTPDPENDWLWAEQKI